MGLLAAEESWLQALGSRAAPGRCCALECCRLRPHRCLPWPAPVIKAGRRRRLSAAFLRAGLGSRCVKSSRPPPCAGAVGGTPVFCGRELLSGGRGGHCKPALRGACARKRLSCSKRALRSQRRDVNDLCVNSKRFNFGTLN